jgi:hypothetical protein
MILSLFITNEHAARREQSRVLVSFRHWPTALTGHYGRRFSVLECRRAPAGLPDHATPRSPANHPGTLIATFRMGHRLERPFG